MAGLREEIVTGPEQVLGLLEAGEARRHIGETNMNKASSRSHTIFRMVGASHCFLPAPEGKNQQGAGGIERGKKASGRGQRE